MDDCSRSSSKSNKEDSVSMKILSSSEIDRDAWRKLVETSGTGTWFQTPEAYDFFASQPDLFVPFVAAVANNPSLSEAQHSSTPSLHEQVLRAICVGYVTVEKNPIKQFFTMRAIIIGGPALADDASSEEVSELLEAIRNGAQKRNDAASLLNDELMSPIYIETRNFNSYERWKSAFEKAGFEYQPHLNFHVDCTDQKAMWIRMSETRRKQIRRAQRADVTISNAQSEEEICEWYAILKRMYKTRVKTPLFPVSFFEEAYRQGVATYLMVRYEGHIIGGSMIVVDGGCVYEWFECGRDVEYEKQYPSVMATYAGMAYAAEHGIARCDFMGAGVPGVPYGVRDFKERFGGKMVEHGRFLYIAKPILYRIGVWGVKIMKGL